MNKSLIISIVVFATPSVSSICVADGDLFDWPGPGYWQQIERAFPAAVKDAPSDICVGTPIIRYSRTSTFPDPHLPNPFPPAKLLDFNDSAILFALAAESAEKKSDAKPSVTEHNVIKVYSPGPTPLRTPVLRPYIFDKPIKLTLEVVPLIPSDRPTELSFEWLK